MNDSILFDSFDTFRHFFDNLSKSSKPRVYWFYIVVIYIFRHLYRYTHIYFIYLMAWGGVSVFCRNCRNVEKQAKTNTYSFMFCLKVSKLSKKTCLLACFVGESI